MMFPALIPTEQEINDHLERSRRLTREVEHATRLELGVSVEVECRGSTAKGTALPESVFELDYDLSILGTDRVIDRLATRSDVFEGCQLFQLSYAQALERHFDRIDYAGHRISGRFEDHTFDLSIADPLKDSWKIEYNGSQILDFDEPARLEVRRAKYLFKRMNVYGSQVYGVVGPAVELAIHHLGSLDAVLETLAAQPRLEASGPRAFQTRPFPEGYRDLFPRPDDPVVEGLIGSFRYTIPNTWDRLVEVARSPTTDPDAFVARQTPRLQQRRIPRIDSRLLILFLTDLPASRQTHIEILPVGSELRLLADDLTGIEPLIDKLVRLPRRGNIPLELLPDRIGEILGAGDSVFMGMPTSLHARGDTQVPIDILVRADAVKLVDILRRSQT